jgi:hypothetical protein
MYKQSLHHYKWVCRFLGPVVGIAFASPRVQDARRYLPPSSSSSVRLEEETLLGFPEFLGAREATLVVLLWGPNRDLLCVFISFSLSAMRGSTCLFYSAKELTTMHGSTCLFYSAKELTTMHSSTCLFYSAKELTTMHGSTCLFYSAKKLSRVLLIYRQVHIL